jgi:haloalkane dehalogenase
MSPTARAGYAFPYRTAAERVAIRRFVEDIPTAPWHPSWSALEEAGRGVELFATRPASILWGERDWCFTPRFREEWQRRLPKATVRALPDVGHLVPEEAPDEIERALRALLAQPIGS